MGEYGSFVHHDRQERLDRERFRRVGRLPMAKARTLIRRRFPEFIIERDGQRSYDLHALDALIGLWAEHGHGNVTAGMLRARRDELAAAASARRIAA